VRSTIPTLQLPVSRWHEQIGDPTLADGTLDRLFHNAHRIEMQGIRCVRIGTSLME
jgi:DNA replication protein DnaC